MCGLLVSMRQRMAGNRTGRWMLSVCGVDMDWEEREIAVRYLYPTRYHGVHDPIVMSTEWVPLWKSTNIKRDWDLL